MPVATRVEYSSRHLGCTNVRKSRFTVQNVQCHSLQENEGHKYIFECSVIKGWVTIFVYYYNNSVLCWLLCETQKLNFVCDNNQNFFSWFVLWSGNVQRCKRQAHVFSPKLKKCPFKTRYETVLLNHFPFGPAQADQQTYS